MTASERMAGMVEAALNAAFDLGVTGVSKSYGPSRTALLAAIGELERARDAQAAEVTRLAGVARDACDVAERVASLLDARSDMATRRGWSRAGRSDIAALRAAIPTPDPAAFVSRAEVARLAGVAREACDGWDRALDGVPDVVSAADRIQSLRDAIPTPDPADDGECTSCGGPSCACVDDATPDPAAFVAAVDRLIESVRVHEGAGPGFGSQALDAVVKSRAALLALGGVR